MANTSAPFGFRQYRGTGSSPTYEQVPGFANYNTAAMYFGDPVFQNSDGSVYPTSPGTGTLAGVFVGCKYLSVSQKRTVWSNYWGAADVASPNLVECYIVNDPNAQFKAQVGGNTTALALADIGQNCQFAYGTGSTSNGISGAYVDMTVARANTATLPFRVVALITSPPGDNGTAASAYNTGIFAFNNVETKTLTGAL